MRVKIVGFLGIFMVKFQKIDLKTYDFAVAQRLKREKATSEGENLENCGNLGKNCVVIKFP